MCIVLNQIEYIFSLLFNVIHHRFKALSPFRHRYHFKVIDLAMVSKNPKQCPTQFRNH